MAGDFQAGQLLQSGQDSRSQFAHQPRITISKFASDVKGGCTGLFFNNIIIQSLARYFTLFNGNFTLCDMQMTNKDSEQKRYLFERAELFHIIFLN